MGLVFERHLRHHFLLIEGLLDRGFVGCATTDHNDSNCCET
jgi:hypothetical protein